MDDSYNKIAVKVVLLSVFGLCSMPLLGCLVKYLDSCVGIGTQTGYLTDPNQYIFTSPLIWLLIIWIVYAVGGIIFLIIHNRNKR